MKRSLMLALGLVIAFGNTAVYAEEKGGDTRFQRSTSRPPYTFRLEIGGVVCARFQDASGMEVPHGTPRRTITLRRGVTTGPGLRAWRQQGNVPPKGGSLVMLDGSGAEKSRWKFHAGQISKWDGPDFNAKGNDVAIETLEIACERIDRED